MERMKKLKLANIFISKLEEIKNLFLSKSEINFSESLKIHKSLNKIITIRNKQFSDIEKRTFYKFIEEGNTNIERCKIYDGEMIDIFSKIERLLYEIVDINEKIEII